MNLWFRLIWYLLTARWRPQLVLPDDVSVLRYRVWPHDIDTSLHLNNARYLGLMDQGRLDIIVSSGLVRAALKHGWTPIANAIEIRFRREFRLFEKIELRTRIVGWRDSQVVMEQVFVSASGARKGHVGARALFAGGLYDRKSKSFVEISRMMREIGVESSSPPLTPEASAFLNSIERLRDVDRSD